MVAGVGDGERNGKRFARNKRVGVKADIGELQVADGQDLRPDEIFCVVYIIRGDRHGRVHTESVGLTVQLCGVQVFQILLVADQEDRCTPMVVYSVIMQRGQIGVCAVGLVKIDAVADDYEVAAQAFDRDCVPRFVVQRAVVIPDKGVRRRAGQSAVYGPAGHVLGQQSAVAIELAVRGIGDGGRAVLRADADRASACGVRCFARVKPCSAAIFRRIDRAGGGVHNAFFIRDRGFGPREDGRSVHAGECGQAHIVVRLIDLLLGERERVFVDRADHDILVLGIGDEGITRLLRRAGIGKPEISGCVRAELRRVVQNRGRVDTHRFRPAVPVKFRQRDIAHAGIRIRAHKGRVERAPVRDHDGLGVAVCILQQRVIFRPRLRGAGGVGLHSCRGPVGLLRKIAEVRRGIRRSLRCRIPRRTGQQGLGFYGIGGV